MFFYSKSTSGFYTSEIHGDNIPADAVEITETEYAALFEGQNQGKLIVTDENGYPILQDPPLPCVEEKAKHIRASRDELLADTDWVVIKALETSQPVPPEWVAYRQALRDITKQPGFPLEVEWPSKPTT